MLPSIALSITDMCYTYGIVMKLLFFISWLMQFQN